MVSIAPSFHAPRLTNGAAERPRNGGNVPDAGDRREELPSRILRALVYLGLLIASGCAAPTTPQVTELTSAFRQNPLVPPAKLVVYLSPDGQRGFFTLERTDAEPVISKSYPMWKHIVADLDGDGSDELLLGIWSHKVRHDEPQPHKTIWVLSWEQRWVETWRGSALARPLSDFVTGDLDGDEKEELVSLERADGRWVLAVYRWNGFGFRGVKKRLLDETLRDPHLSAAPPTLHSTDRAPLTIETLFAQ